MQKKIINVMIIYIYIMIISVVMPTNIYAFDFETDLNQKKFNQGCERTYTTYIKANEVIWFNTIWNSGITNNLMCVEHNGVTLAEIKEKDKRADIKLEFRKYSEKSKTL